MFFYPADMARSSARGLLVDSRRLSPHCSHIKATVRPRFAGKRWPQCGLNVASPWPHPPIGHKQTTSRSTADQQGINNKLTANQRLFYPCLLVSRNQKRVIMTYDPPSLIQHLILIAHLNNLLHIRRSQRFMFT